MADVYRVLQAVQPHVVVAFHPTGISGHVDHQTMTAFATAAVERLWTEGTGDPDDYRTALQLHYYTIPASVVRQIQFREMPLVPDEDITIELDTAAFAEVKRRAIFCHKTQLAFYERLKSVPGPDGRFAIERYVTHRAAPRARRGTDLFAANGRPG
jgi:LmbE family N-acetylglucosaminyl deacetylase